MSENVGAVVLAPHSRAGERWASGRLIREEGGGGRQGVLVPAPPAALVREGAALEALVFALPLDEEMIVQRVRVIEADRYHDDAKNLDTVLYALEHRTLYEALFLGPDVDAIAKMRRAQGGSLWAALQALGKLTGDRWRSISAQELDEARALEKRQSPVDWIDEGGHDDSWRCWFVRCR
ncbi:hypothetical protein [Actinomycetospora flava]|uniref:Nucleotidyltransferase AbiEii toxin of type IV toxin-antitoxin system n=1 Tax=Actinomycetospora flava TaxID=3129232 RepID=A0ABU8M7Y3_9PSEU